MVTILAIDDKQDNLISQSNLLKKLIPDCNVITAQSGNEGIEKARAALPDTILLDMRMAETDGFEVCRTLKSDANTRHIPVIMVTTSKTDPKDHIKGLKTGADAFLSQPFDEAEFAAQIRAMLRIKKAEDVSRKEKGLLEGMVQERTKQLNESDERFRSLVQSASDAIISIDHRGNIISWNRAAEIIFGYTADEAIGKPFTLLAPERFRKNSKRAFNELTSTAKSHFIGKPVENPGIRKDGSEFPAEISYAAWETEVGTFFTAIARDISERKRYEEEKEKIQAQLRQGQKMEAIGTLAGGIAHDFNNILSAIIGYTELALYFDSESTSARELLEQVLKASKRAKDLVTQILAFSRQSEQELKPVMTSPLIKETLRLLRASLPTTIEIRQNITTESSTVLADPTQIHQVLMNLCTNASYAMRENGGVLDVSLIPFDLDPNATINYPDLTPGPYLKLTVSDTGHGMNRAVMEHIFDPFFTTKESGRGTGMGLSVVHGIVTSYGGTIIPESEPGKGTTFHVFFPRLEKKIPAEAETVSPILTGNECILFVDDEEAIAHMGQQMLECLGYEVFARTSSIEALEVFRSQPDKFDLILTDQIMPNMTGENLAKKIMQIRPEIPIVLCTGFTETTTPEKARAMGFKELLLKPVIIRDLAEAIRRVLDRNPKEQMDK